MQVTVESGEGLEKRLNVDLPPEQVAAEVDKKLQQLSRTLRMDGFRPGKVPLRVIRQRFGEQVRQEVFGDMIKATFYEAASKEQLRPAGEPRIELRDGDQGYGYTAVFEVMPEIVLGELTALTVQRPVAEVMDSDVDAMVEKLRNQRTTWNEVDRPAQDGDTLHIDFVGYVDGEAFEGGNASDVPLRLGSGAMIAGFEAGLVGASAGESRTLDVQFPTDYRAANLAGKPARFEVVVHKVAEPVLPTLDADFAKAFGVEDGNVDTLRSEIRDNMARELRQKLRNLTKEQVFDALLAANPLTLPKAMVTEEAQRLKKQTQAELAQSGQGNVIDFPVSMFEPQAERRVALGLLIGEIIRAQGIKVDPARVRSTVEEFASSYENPQEVIDYYFKDRGQRAAIENLVLEEQVMDWLLGQVHVEDQQRSFADLMESGR